MVESSTTTPQAKIVLVLIDGLSDTNHKDIGCKREMDNYQYMIDKTPL